MSRRKAFLLKLLVYLFFLNSISVFIYLSHYTDHLRFKSQSEKDPLFQNHRKQQQQQPLEGKKKNSQKSWPMLPSYSPWRLDPNVRVQSCEGYFGSGFNKKIDLLIRSPEIQTGSSSSSNSGGRGWFRCFYSKTLESSICEGGRVRMNIDRINMSRGGENLELVIGRGEEEELPTFEPGSFEIEVDNDHQTANGTKLVNQEFLDQFVPRGVVVHHTMRSLLDSIRLVNSDEFKCSQWIDEPILLVTRFEYANLFHTVTDWYSAYAASRVTGVPMRPHLVFLDGHCKSQLEETWDALFSSLRYAKNFSGSVCFRHVILSPLGYETALFKGLTEVINCQGTDPDSLWQDPDLQTARLTEFGEMIRASFGFPIEEIRVQKSQVPRHNVLFVRREDYLAHPRHGGRVESRLDNEQEVFDSLKDWINNNSFGCEVNLVNGLFAHMHMKEQVRAIQDASVIIGAHGAGLTHIVSATPKTIILEIISSYFRRPHFALISQWRGLVYHAINVEGATAEPAVVIGYLRQILGSLGC